MRVYIFCDDNDVDKYQLEIASYQTMPPLVGKQKMNPIQVPVWIYCLNEDLEV